MSETVTCYICKQKPATTNSGDRNGLFYSTQ
jgi:hypothetical protein